VFNSIYRELESISIVEDIGLKKGIIGRISKTESITSNDWGMSEAKVLMSGEKGSSEEGASVSVSIGSQEDDVPAVSSSR
jgi:hypothetical protein